jgi:NADP-reducing hydrogenase subunit HndB
MNRLTNIADLIKVRDEYKAAFGLRPDGYRAKVTVHMGPCGVAAGARKVMAALMDEIARTNVTDVLVTTSSCGGLCAREPLATVELINRPPVKYCDLNDRKIREIFKEHIMGRNPAERYALVIGCETTC